MKTEQFTIKLGDKNYPVMIKRKNNKHTYIRIDENQHILVTTNSISRDQIMRLILNHENQIIQKIEAELNKKLPDDRFYYLGKTVLAQFKDSNRFRYRVEEEQVIFFKRENQTKEDCLNAFYKREAMLLLPKRLEVCANHFRHFYAIPTEITLSIRKMKSRHGVCYYGKDKVVLNQNLLRSPIEMIDFVIYHELTHFIHPNHSKSFYHVLSQFVPNHRELRRDLNKM
jgi:predicted metal-dependent hydrolase